MQSGQAPRLHQELSSQCDQLELQLRNLISEATAAPLQNEVDGLAADGLEAADPDIIKRRTAQLKAALQQLARQVNAATIAQSRDRDKRFHGPTAQDVDQAAYDDDDTISVGDICCFLYEDDSAAPKRKQKKRKQPSHRAIAASQAQEEDIDAAATADVPARPHRSSRRKGRAQRSSREVAAPAEAHNQADVELPPKRRKHISTLDGSSADVCAQQASHAAAATPVASASLPERAVSEGRGRHTSLLSHELHEAPSSTGQGQILAAAPPPVRHGPDTPPPAGASRRSRRSGGGPQSHGGSPPTGSDVHAQTRNRASSRSRASHAGHPAGQLSSITEAAPSRRRRRFARASTQAAEAPEQPCSSSAAAAVASTSMAAKKPKYKLWFGTVERCRYQRTAGRKKEFVMAARLPKQHATGQLMMRWLTEETNENGSPQLISHGPVVQQLQPDGTALQKQLPPCSLRAFSCPLSNPGEQLKQHLDVRDSNLVDVVKMYHPPGKKCLVLDDADSQFCYGFLDACNQQGRVVAYDEVQQGRRFQAGAKYDQAAMQDTDGSPITVVSSRKARRRVTRARAAHDD